MNKILTLILVFFLKKWYSSRNWKLNINRKITYKFLNIDIIKKSNLNYICFTKELIDSSFDYSYLIKNNKLWNCPIEKIAFTFWHGNEFTYLHFLSIETL